LPNLPPNANRKRKNCFSPFLDRNCNAVGLQPHDAAKRTQCRAGEIAALGNVAFVSLRLPE